MPLLEKAYAKFEATYDRIQGGLGHQSLRTLTGMPSYRVNFQQQNSQELWNFIKVLTDKGYPITTGCCQHRGKGYGGVSGSHAYTLQDLVTLSNGVRLAKIRNPWSSEAYRGDWSDHSSKWTAKLKREVGHTKANDGVFFYPWDKYVTNYKAISFALHQRYAIV